jgi:hypothetical protein
VSSASTALPTTSTASLVSTLADALLRVSRRAVSGGVPFVDTSNETATVIGGDRRATVLGVLQLALRCVTRHESDAQWHAVRVVRCAECRDVLHRLQ